MPDLVEQMYCSQQIHIPPTFPYILKQYAKAAIRTQPYDLLHWSASYFRAMAQGDVPPVKKRLEYPPVDTPSGLSPGYLKVLVSQLGNKAAVVPASVLYDKWNGICLKEPDLTSMLKLGELEEEVDWLKFVAVAAGHLTKSLTQTMYLICEMLTEEPEGGSDMISLEVFSDLYRYLAKIDCTPPQAEGEEQDKEEAEEEEKDEEAAEGPEPGEGEDDTEAPATGEGEDDDTEAPATGEGEEESQEEPPAETVNRAVPGIGPIIDDAQIESVLRYLESWAERQEGMVMPRNIHHYLCPTLDKMPVTED